MHPTMRLHCIRMEHIRSLGTQLMKQTNCIYSLDELIHNWLILLYLENKTMKFKLKLKAEKLLGIWKVFANHYKQVNLK
jgi:hypothetical protein